MSHDPMCPTINADVPFGLFHDDVTDDCLFCPYIAAVRQDERAKALDAAREAVAEAPIAIREPAVLLLNRDVALAAIDALREEKK